MYMVNSNYTENGLKIAWKGFKISPPSQQKGPVHTLCTPTLESFKLFQHLDSESSYIFVILFIFINLVLSTSILSTGYNDNRPSNLFLRNYERVKENRVCHGICARETLRHRPFSKLCIFDILIKSLKEIEFIDNNVPGISYLSTFLEDNEWPLSWQFFGIFGIFGLKITIFYFVRLTYDNKQAQHILMAYICHSTW